MLFFVAGWWGNAGLKLAGEGFEEVESEGDADAEERTGVNCAPVENLVDVGPAAVEAFGEPRHGQSFFRDFLVYQFPDVDHMTDSFAYGGRCARHPANSPLGCRL